jgi:DNA polymerase-1
MGAKGYQAYARNNYGVEMTEDQAKSYRAAFFGAYLGLKRWHRRTGSGKDDPIDTRTLIGRRRASVTRFTEKLNSPVQGTGADGLKLALALLWERRGQIPGAFPVLAVHDEIVLEADAGQAQVVADVVKTAMLDAMTPLIDPVPIEVEVKIAPTWGG